MTLQDDRRPMQSSERMNDATNDDVGFLGLRECSHSPLTCLLHRFIHCLSILHVTCRWHVRLNVSGIGAVANSMELAVLSSDSVPLLAESFGELTGFRDGVRVHCYVTAGTFTRHGFSLDWSVTKQ
jgi:hypothetical protein